MLQNMIADQILFILIYLFSLYLLCVVFVYTK